MIKNIGIIGMGLIGGSMAKHLRKVKNLKIFCKDIDISIEKQAVFEQVCDGILEDKELKKCDMLVVALYPKETVEYILSVVDKVKKGCIIIDICGVKEYITDKVKKACEDKGIIFIGCHPMAGREVGGYVNSSEDLFKNASMIITEDEPMEVVAELKALFLASGFKQVVITTIETHDSIMAYTSQLAHVASGAFIKSPTSRRNEGFSAGSFKDMTRVAKLNPYMWAALFINNRENLVRELDIYVENLLEYKKALATNDRDMLYDLLKDGNDIKEKLGHD